MRTKSFRSSRVPQFTFESEVMSPIGGTGPQADRGAAWEAIRLRLCLLPQPTGKPFADFWIGLEADESAPAVAGWLQLAECVMSRIGAADSLWWAFLHDGPNGRPHMHISTYLVDSSGQAVGTRLRLGRLNLDGSTKIRTAGSDQ
jgi:hypothetical protein